MLYKKISILYIIDILRKYSDVDHPLTQQNIIDKLYYEYGIEMERKTISSTISLLIDYGYDINKINKKGFYLAERELNENEIRFLVDAIFSSKSISGKDAINLTNKLNRILSKYQKKDYSYVYKSLELNKLQKSDLFLNIEIITAAIKEDKQISFNYLIYDQSGTLIKRKDGYRYRISPYYLINNYGNYYLLSNIEKYETPSYFRIEHMANIEIIDKKRKDIKTTTLGSNFNISSHINNHVYMFSSNVITAKIEILQEWAITYIFDWFSKNARVVYQNNKTYAYIKSNEDAFIYWFLQYQKHYKIIEPADIKQKILDTIKESLSRY